MRSVRGALATLVLRSSSFAVMAFLMVGPALVQAVPEVTHESPWSGSALAREPSLRDVRRYLEGDTDCDGNGVTDTLDIARGRLDVDRNGLPDQPCDVDRLNLWKEVVAACPAGDGDTIGFDLELVDVKVVNVANPDLRIYAVRVAGWTDSLWTWSAGRGITPLDTLWARAYDPALALARFEAPFVMGCAELWLDFYANDTLVVDSALVVIASFDRNPLSLGCVDRLDTLGRAVEAMTCRGTCCFDHDDSGSVTEADERLWSAHWTHHVPRGVLVPERGVFAWNESLTCRWQPGRGDSNRVSILLRRDGPVRNETALAIDRPDDGFATVQLSDRVAPGPDYRLVVRHTIGAWNGMNAVGETVSEGTFEVRRPWSGR
jgi:hypothetical protein